jgi:hypothetical protein
VTQEQVPEATLFGTLDNTPAGQGTGGPIGEPCEQNDMHGTCCRADDKGVRPSKVTTIIVTMQSIIARSVGDTIPYLRSFGSWRKQEA